MTKRFRAKTSWANHWGEAFKRGDRVLLLQARHWPFFAHRANPRKVYGRVTKVNGGYVYVRPSWVKWETEAYATELRKA